MGNKNSGRRPRGSGERPRSTYVEPVSAGRGADEVLKKFRKWMSSPPKDAKAESRREAIWEATYERATVSKPGAPASAGAQEMLLSYDMGKPLQAVTMEVTKSRDEMLEEIKQKLEYVKGINDGDKPAIQ